MNGWGSVTGGSRDSLYAIMCMLALRPTRPLVQWVAAAVLPKLKYLGRSARHSPASNFEADDACGCVSDLPYTLKGSVWLCI